jgi:flagellin-like protein
MRIPTKKRKAISPVLATVILIAITLIAAIAIAGFVFGLFGSFTSSAQVSAQVISCSHPNATDNCLITLRNTGTSNAAVTGCSIRVNGISVVGATSPVIGPSVLASGTRNVGCQAAGVPQTVGSQAVGSFSMSNGASVPFTGVWS